MKNKANVNIISTTDGREVMQSYGTTVAAFIPGRGYVKTRDHFSPTTSRHVNQYVGSPHAAEIVDHADLLKLTKPIESRK